MLEDLHMTYKEDVTNRTIVDNMQLKNYKHEITVTDNRKFATTASLFNISAIIV